jgi:hypothetical protein
VVLSYQWNDHQAPHADGLKQCEVLVVARERGPHGVGHLGDELGAPAPHHGELQGAALGITTAQLPHHLRAGGVDVLDRGVPERLVCLQEIDLAHVAEALARQPGQAQDRLVEVERRGKLEAGLGHLAHALEGIRDLAEHLVGVGVARQGFGDAAQEREPCLLQGRALDHHHSILRRHGVLSWARAGHDPHHRRTADDPSAIGISEHDRRS